MLESIVSILLTKITPKNGPIPGLEAEQLSDQKGKKVL
jgi:hypothetical protein